MCVLYIKDIYIYNIYIYIIYIYIYYFIMLYIHIMLYILCVIYIYINYVVYIYICVCISVCVCLLDSSCYLKSTSLKNCLKCLKLAPVNLRKMRWSHRIDSNRTAKIVEWYMTSQKHGLWAQCFWLFGIANWNHRGRSQTNNFFRTRPWIEWSVLKSTSAPSLGVCTSLIYIHMIIKYGRTPWCIHIVNRQTNIYIYICIHV